MESPMSDKAFPAANAPQIDYWNASAGQTWAIFQEQLDRQIEPLPGSDPHACAVGR